jgi:endonuclease/exonuclease/phosphatase (EEP) superfamily protein YafD
VGYPSWWCPALVLNKWNMTALLRCTAVAVLLLGVSVIRWRVAAAHAHLFVRVAVLGGGDSPVALVS